MRQNGNGRLIPTARPNSSLQPALLAGFSFRRSTLDDYRIERTTRGVVVIRTKDNKKIADFPSMANALWYVDGLQSKRRRQAGDRDAQHS
jgi:hypothetical protein